MRQNKHRYFDMAETHEYDGEQNDGVQGVTPESSGARTARELLSANESIEGSEERKRPDRAIGIRPGFLTLDSLKAPLDTNPDHFGKYVISGNEEDPLKGTITIINPEGNAVLASDTDYTRDTLEASGYTIGTDLEPLEVDLLLASHDEQLDYTWGRTNGENHYLDAYKKSIAKPDAIDFYGEEMGGRWIVTDGLDLATADGLGTEPGVRTYDPETVKHRVKEVGHYDINNGVIAAIDGRGYAHEAPWTDDRIKALEGAGYTRSDAGVGVTLGTKAFAKGSSAETEWANIKRADVQNKLRDEQREFEEKNRPTAA